MKLALIVHAVHLNFVEITEKNFNQSKALFS